MAEKAGVHTKAQESKQKCSNFCIQRSGNNLSRSSADRVLQLQRTAGNQAVQRLIKSKILQAKLRVGQPDDIYEKEADRVAEQVMKMSEPVLQRKCAKFDKDEKKFLQGKELIGQMSIIQGQNVPSIVYEVLNSPGQQLDLPTRAFMEQRFSHDFSRVRVHSNAAAEESAREVNAKAYTVGHNIVFGTGQLLPGTNEGRRLIAHELTHVVQQRSAESGSCPTCPLSKVLQRQAEESSAPVTQLADLELPERSFGIQVNDPPCPSVPTGLGDVKPEVNCPESAEDIGLRGRHFHFCLDSDVFAFPGTPTEVAKFARSKPSKSIFKVHGYSSLEGRLDYNMNLACHRALRVARDLINAGVRSEQIEIANKGPTNDFPGGPELNRVVVVFPEVPSTDKQPLGPLPMNTVEEKRKVVQMAKDSIGQGNYNLGADAYLSFWTCGKMPRLSDAVERTQVLVPGESGMPKENVVKRDGMAEGIGFNTIALSDDILDAKNQLDCVTGRIVDMVFHQMVINSPDFKTFGERHKAASFLLNLAGFYPCIYKDGTVGESPLYEDPRVDKPTPECLEAPLPGPKIRKGKGKKDAKIPEFKLESLGVQGSSGDIIWYLNESGKTAYVSSERFPYVARAEVRLLGNPAEFKNYEVGFIQTITFDETLINYVSGDSIKEALPVPIRDRERKSGKSPWFSEEFVAIPDDSGIANTLMFKSVLSEIEMSLSSDNNVIDTAERNIQMLFWPVARKKGAPLDRFSTHFLELGTKIDFTQTVDVNLIGTSFEGKGKFKTLIDTPSEEDKNKAQLGGPVPDDLGPAEKNIHIRPPSRKEAGKISVGDLSSLVREIIDGLTPKRKGVSYTDLNINILFNRETGRIVVPPGNNVPIDIFSPGVPENLLKNLARELFIRLRKKNFLGRPGKDVIIKPRSRDESDLKNNMIIGISISASSPIVLIDKVKPTLKEMWEMTRQTIRQLDPREVSTTFYVDLKGNVVRSEFIVGPPERAGDEKRKVKICPAEKPGPDLTVLGSAHTHPDEGEPSGDDIKSPLGPAQNPDICGTQHYVVSEDSVFYFNKDGWKKLGKRERLLEK